MNIIYFFIGTKAQIIKCLPLMERLSEVNNCKVVLVNSGQHKSIVQELISNSPFIFEEEKLYKNKKDITRYLQALLWFFSFTFSHLLKKNKNINKSLNNICIVHGDTISTFLGSMWAKKNNLKLVHLESGLTSGKLFIPFPEEIVRRVVAKISKILISFDNDSFGRLAKKYNNKIIFNAGENTIIETLGNSLDSNSTNLIVATLHRTENLLSRKNFNKFIELLNGLPEKYDVIWYIHKPTQNFLDRYKTKLSKNIQTSNLINHDDFINQIKKSSFVITDGGSIQEECYYLGKNTIIWRDRTERPVALNDNMLISRYSVSKSQSFINKYIEKVHKPKNIISPSNEIVKFFREKNLLT